MNASAIGYLIKVHPNQAKVKILDALRKAKMHKGNAAVILGCRHATLLDWLTVLDLHKTVERMIVQAKREGWFHGRVGGRPSHQE